MYLIKNIFSPFGEFNYFQFLCSKNSIFNFLHNRKESLLNTCPKVASISKSWILLCLFFFCNYSNLFSQTYSINTAKYASSDIVNNTSCDPGAKCAKYLAGMSITGFMTFSQFLSPNLNRATATIVDYKINDGINTFTPQNSFVDRAVYVTTNSNGDLVSVETLFRQWQDPNKTTIGSYLNEIWLYPDFSYVLNAVRCDDQGSPGAVIRHILV